MPTVAYHTLGCKVNQYETQAMEELLSAAGYPTVFFITFHGIGKAIQYRHQQSETEGNLWD